MSRKQEKMEVYVGKKWKSVITSRSDKRSKDLDCFIQLLQFRVPVNS